MKNNKKIGRWRITDRCVFNSLKQSAFTLSLMGNISFVIFSITKEKVIIEFTMIFFLLSIIILGLMFLTILRRDKY